MNMFEEIVENPRSHEAMRVFASWTAENELSISSDLDSCAKFLESESATILVPTGSKTDDFILQHEDVIYKKTYSALQELLKGISNSDSFSEQILIEDWSTKMLLIFSDLEYSRQENDLDPDKHLLLKSMYAVWHLTCICHCTTQDSVSGRELALWFKRHQELLSIPETSTSSFYEAKISQFYRDEVPESSQEYWDLIFSAVVAGWMDVAAQLLQMHSACRPSLNLEERPANIVELVCDLLEQFPLQLGAEQPEDEAKSKDMKDWVSLLLSLFSLSDAWEHCHCLTTLNQLSRLLRSLLHAFAPNSSSTAALAPSAMPRLELEYGSHWILTMMNGCVFSPATKLDSLDAFQLSRQNFITLVSFSVEQFLEEGHSMEEISSSEKLFLAIMMGDFEEVVLLCSEIFGCEYWFLCHLFQLLRLLLPESSSAGAQLAEAGEEITLQCAMAISRFTKDIKVAAWYASQCPMSGPLAAEQLLWQHYLSLDPGGKFGDPSECKDILSLCQDIGLSSLSHRICQRNFYLAWGQRDLASALVWLNQGESTDCQAMTKKLLDYFLRHRVLPAAMDSASYFLSSTVDFCHDSLTSWFNRDLWEGDMLQPLPEDGALDKTKPLTHSAGEGLAWLTGLSRLRQLLALAMKCSVCESTGGLALGEVQEVLAAGQLGGSVSQLVQELAPQAIKSPLQLAVFIITLYPAVKSRRLNWDGRDVDSLLSAVTSLSGFALEAEKFATPEFLFLVEDMEWILMSAALASC